MIPKSDLDGPVPDQRFPPHALKLAAFLLLSSGLYILMLQEYRYLSLGQRFPFEVLGYTLTLLDPLLAVGLLIGGQKLVLVCRIRAISLPACVLLFFSWVVEPDIAMGFFIFVHGLILSVILVGTPGRWRFRAAMICSIIYFILVLFIGEIVVSEQGAYSHHPFLD